MRKRIALWDNLKLFLIYLVVLGHLTLQYFDESRMFGIISLVVYTFHMPAFIFVSGIFSKHGVHSQSFPVKRVFGFIVIYIFTRILNYSANIVFGKQIDFDFFCCDDIPWYMLAMALWYSITWVLKCFDSKYIFTISVIIGCFAGYMQGNTDFLAILRVITYYPFFYAGYLLDAEKIEKAVSKKPVKIFSAVFFTGFIVICTVFFEKLEWLFPLLTGRRKFEDLDTYGDWGCLIRLGYYIVVSLLIISVISLCPKKKYVTSKYGASTLQIYMYHRPLLYIMKNAGLFDIIVSTGKGWEWLAVFVTVVLTALLCPKVLGKPLNYLMNPKERKNNAASQ